MQKMNEWKEGRKFLGRYKGHELIYMYVPCRVYELVLNIDFIERWATCIHFIKVKVWMHLSHAVKVLTSRVTSQLSLIMSYLCL